MTLALWMYFWETDDWQNAVVVNPAVATFVVPTVTLTVAATVVIDATAATFASPAMGVSAPANVAINAAVATFSVPAIGITEENVIALDATVATFASPAMGVSAPANVAINAGVATFVVPTISLTVSATVVLPAIVATFVVPTPITLGGNLVELTPAVATFVVPTISITAPVTVAINATVATFVVGTPVTTTAGDVAFTPAVATFVVPTITITIDANISINASVASYVAPTLSITAPVTASINVSVVKFIVPLVTIAGDIELAVTVMTAIVPSPVTSSPANVAINASAILFVVPTVTIAAPATVVLSVVVATFASPGIGVSAPAIVALTTSVVTFVVPTMLLNQFSVGDPGSYAATVNGIRIRYGALIETPFSVPTQYDNFEFDPPTAGTACWCRVSVDFEETIQQAYGTQNRFRKRGDAVFMIRCLIAKGDEDALILADRINNAFRETFNDSIRYHKPTIMPRQRDGIYWKIEVRVPFKTDLDVNRPASISTTTAANFEDAHNAIRTRFKNKIEDPEAIYVEYDDAPFQSLSNAKWIRWAIVTGNSRRTSGSGVQHRWRTEGIATAMIFVRIGKGDRDGLDLADLVDVNFRAQAHDGVQYETPSINIVGRNPSVPSWWQTNLSCPFYFEEKV